LTIHRIERIIDISPDQSHVKSQPYMPPKNKWQKKREDALRENLYRRKRQQRQQEKTNADETDQNQPDKDHSESVTESGSGDSSPAN
jgi:hypothetical protein